MGRINARVGEVSEIGANGHVGLRIRKLGQMCTPLNLSGPIFLGFCKWQRFFIPLFDNSWKITLSNETTAQGCGSSGTASHSRNAIQAIEMSGSKPHLQYDCNRSSAT